MIYTFDTFPVECGHGWDKLIQPIFDYINEYNLSRKDDERIEIRQIKEKFGLLQVYVSHGTNELYDMIDKATSESNSICEQCGSTKEIGITRGWITHLCKECVIKMSIEEKRDFIWKKRGEKNWYKVSNGTLTKI